MERSRTIQGKKKSVLSWIVLDLSIYLYAVATDGMWPPTGGRLYWRIIGEKVRANPNDSMHIYVYIAIYSFMYNYAIYL